MIKLRLILTQRPIPLLWVVVIAYALISPMALLIPVDVFARYPWTRDFTNAVAVLMPMIDRVVAYGHPYPDKLRCFLAYAWCCVPVLMWLQHRANEQRNKPLSWGPGAIEILGRSSLAIVLLLFLAFLIWYWPNFPVGEKEMLTPIALPHDERRQLLWSTSSLFLYAPIWFTCFAGLLDPMRCELLNLLWRMGIVSAYPSSQHTTTSTPSLK